MSEPLSVHDNVLLSLWVDCAHRQIVLRTMYERPDDQSEYTNIVFDDVLAYHFQSDNFGTILFDVEEEPLERTLENWQFVFEERKNYGWLPFKYEDTSDVWVRLSESGIKSFGISASYGMVGFVLAKPCVSKPPKNNLLAG